MLSPTASDVRVFVPAKDFMIHVSIDDAQAWYELASSIIVTGEYLDAKVNRPAPQAYGALVTHLWDPSGVLLHLAQWNPD
jgi:hypothetical protein